MTSRSLQNKQPLIRQALSFVAGNDNQAENDDYLRFARLFLRSLPIESLNEKSPDHHARILRTCWKALSNTPAEKATIVLSTPVISDENLSLLPTTLVIVAQDMPWLVESVRTELNRNNIAIQHIQNAVLNLERDDRGRISRYEDPVSGLTLGAKAEAIIYIEIDRHSDVDMLDEIESGLTETLRILYQAHQQRDVIIDKLKWRVEQRIASDTGVIGNESQETRDFIEWLSQENFLFLGYEELVSDADNGEVSVTQQIGPILFPATEQSASLHVMFNEYARLLYVKKDSHRCEFYRRHYYHQIIVSQNDGKHLSRVYGLFTSTAILTPPEQIPLVREKILRVKKLSGLQSGGHRTRELSRILHTYPWEELLIASTNELLHTVMGIYNLQERRGATLFVRVDPSNEYVSCLFFVPKDTYCTALRLRVQQTLLNYFSGTDITFNTSYSDSILSRTHFYLTRDPSLPVNPDFNALNLEVVRVSQSWQDQLLQALQARLGEEAGNAAFYRFGQAFSLGYQESHNAQEAVEDICYLMALSTTHPLSLRVDQPVHGATSRLTLKIFSCGQPLMLSEVVPILDNAGVQVESENTWPIDTHLAGRCWIHQFSLIYSSQHTILTSPVLANWRENVANVIGKQTENDRLNRLILDAGISGTEVTMLRALSRYLHQLRLGYSNQFIIETLIQYPELTKKMVAFFKTRFDPAIEDRDLLSAQQSQELNLQMEQVSSLNEERVFRSLFELILAMARTSLWQRTAEDQPLPFMAFKFRPQLITGVRQPCPAFEVFVYSPLMEGVHLRFGHVARGGLRWSDRVEDYRTEVLGLVKAQRVKNAVIVPVGAKGGFIVRHPAKNLTQAETAAEGINCYKLFIRGILSITDNLVNNKVVPPEQTLRYDEDDPYLVVAADKGTATFSDIANQIASDAHFWLDDAFASGGSQGYDHKKMGITARGAWESVKRHFYENGLHSQTDTFSVIGIGDMAGDVFGNGMLLSPTIKLIAAFNHKHIFIDPEPDCAVSFNERKRLFDLPGSAWSDYRSGVISSGGGVFSRSQKRITITPEMQRRFAITATVLSPDELIKAILCCECDMLWSGGIGTYVKATIESDLDVGDKNNDNLRVNARDLKCKIVAEGGNLGLTQLARCEFAEAGGAINTDFIDNAGGVDCSDHEVNIKILLNLRVARQLMTISQRNAMLKSMTDSVANSVINHNRQQALALSLAQDIAVQQADANRQLITHLEQQGGLVRELEYIPDDATLVTRKKEGKGLTRPELAVLLSYAKSSLKQAFIDDNLASWSFAGKAAFNAFPQKIISQYSEDIAAHPLHREIVATQVANEMVNCLGPAFYYQLQQRTGASNAEVALVWLAVKEIFSLGHFWGEAEKCGEYVTWGMQSNIYHALTQFVSSACRSILMSGENIVSFLARLSQLQYDLGEFEKKLPDLIVDYAIKGADDKMAALRGAGVDKKLALLVCHYDLYLSFLEITNTAHSCGKPVEALTPLYMLLRKRLKLDELSQAVEKYRPQNSWQTLARETWLNDLSLRQRDISLKIVGQGNVTEQNLHDIVCRWLEERKEPLQKWDKMMSSNNQIDAGGLSAFAMILRDLELLIS